ncbi:MAG: hypothetical protein JNL06_13530 [Alphaproteobacteria bacterium]|nr:hypothetical protein [Alphaproteobacteria bacterium]
MSGAPKRPGDPARHLLAVALVAGGVIILAALGAFVFIAIGFRQSFTASLPPVEDLALGLAALSPFVLLALFMIGYGRRMLRREPPAE